VILIVHNTMGMNCLRIVPFRLRQCKVTRYLPVRSKSLWKCTRHYSLFEIRNVYPPKAGCKRSKEAIRPQDKLKSFVRVCVLADLRSTLQVIIGVSSDRPARQFKQRCCCIDDAIAIYWKIQFLFFSRRNTPQWISTFALPRLHDHTQTHHTR
jgi:hypothetical protein